ncbi:MAG: substrate-binding domain-containing protein [Verrucomicrobia bacterium]|nr:substrate-binding domain-containing protein [Verrucomicrobiota bacterium]
MIEPPVTMIWRDMALIGKHAAALVLERLGKNPRADVRTVTVPSEVILRQSCAPPRKVERI